MFEERPRTIKPASFFQRGGLLRQCKTLLEAPNFTGSDFCQTAEAMISSVGGDYAPDLGLRNSRLIVDQGRGCAYAVHRRNTQLGNSAWVEMFPLWYVKNDGGYAAAYPFRNHPVVEEDLTWEKGQDLPVVVFSLAPSAIVRRDDADARQKLLTAYHSFVLDAIIDLSGLNVSGEEERSLTSQRAQAICGNVLDAIRRGHIQDDQPPGRNYLELIRVAGEGIALSRMGCSDTFPRLYRQDSCGY